MKNYEKLQELKPEIFKRLTGVKPDIFKAMLEVCQEHHDKKNLKLDSYTHDFKLYKQSRLPLPQMLKLKPLKL